MIIVAGVLVVDPATRGDYLEGCVGVIQAARRAEGCLDFAISADLVDPARINIYEQWRSREELERFRGSGPPSDQLAALREIRVTEFEAEEV